MNFINKNNIKLKNKIKTIMNFINKNKIYWRTQIPYK